MTIWGVLLICHFVVAAPLLVLDLVLHSALPLGRRIREDLLWEWYLMLDLVEAMADDSN